MNWEKHLRQSWGIPANSGKGERPHKGDWDRPIRDTAEKPEVQCHRSQGNSVFKMKCPLILMVLFLPSTSQFLERNRSKIFSHTEVFFFCSIFLECSFSAFGKRKKKFCVFFYYYFLRHLSQFTSQLFFVSSWPAQYLAHSGSSMNVSWMNEWLNQSYK